MKLTLLLLLASILHVSASTYAQRINLTMQNQSIENVLSEIRKQSGYSVIYSTEAVVGLPHVTVAIKNATVEQALAAIVEDMQLNYVIKGKVITLTPVQSVSTREDVVKQRIVRGYVRDAQGEAVKGATITVTTNKAISTLSNEQGYFEIPAVSDGQQLEISFLGFNTLKIAASYTPMDIILSASNVDIEEVVVHTGFQTLNKERATGSFGTVSKEQLEKPSLSIAQRIIGTTAGVQANLDVDGKPRFEIRGQSSLFADAAPLVVVDGFPIQGDFESINPNDVESVTILKDAAAASIWGARAANGVIVVVTRNAGRGNPLKVDFQAFTRVGAKVDLDYVNPLASSAQTVEYEKMAFNRWGAREITGAINNDYFSAWSPASVLMAEHHLGFIGQQERDNGLEKLKTLSNKQQISDHLLANPVNQQYNLSLQGSSGKMNNYLSLLYERNQSNFKKTFNDKYMINFRSNTHLLSWLRLDVGAMLNMIDNNNSGITLSGGNGTEYGIADFSPYEMLLDDEGNYTNISQLYRPGLEREVPMSRFPYADWGYNPIQEINSRNLAANSLNTRLQAGLSINPIKGLTYDIKGQYELFNTQTRNYYGEDTYLVRSIVNQATTWDRSSGRLIPNLSKGAILDQNRNKTASWNIRNQLSYNELLGSDHAINAVAGSEIANRVVEYFENPRTYGYNDETLTVGAFPNGPGGPFALLKDWMGANQTFRYTNLFQYGTQRFFSLFGNAAYTYKGKYTLSGSVRTDASNMITDDPKYRYSPFWSLGGSWNIGQEHFSQDQSWLNRLIVRLTYGYNGNVDPTTAFRPLIALASLPNVFTNDYTATISSFGNPSLRWEKTGSWNLGVDYAFFNNKLFGKIDLYRKNGRDLIAELSIPAVAGTTIQKLNNAEMQNTGVEVEIGTQIPIRDTDVSWSGSFNLSYNKNTITKMFVANYPSYMLTNGGTSAYVEGNDANSLWMFDYAGVQNNQPVIRGENGDFYDLGRFAPGDGRNYMVNTGTTVAPYTLGFINSFKVYDFNLSFIMTGKFGHVFKNQPFNYPVLWTTRLLPNTRLDDILVSDQNQMVPLPLNENEPQYYFWGRFTEHMSYLAANASHIRMQEVFLSYNLPTAKWRGLGSTRASVFFQGNDLFVYSFNDLGEDPEYPLGTLNPRPKFTFGIKASF